MIDEFVYLHPGKKEKEMTTKVKFSYLVDPEDSSRVITVARRLVGDSIEFGISVCNPKDFHYKKMARRLAEGRMEKHPVAITIEPDTHPMETIAKEAGKHVEALLPPKQGKDFVYPTFFDRVFQRHLEYTASVRARK